MVVVFVLILLIITLVVGVVDVTLLKLLLLDKTLLLFWCAADDEWPLASVALDERFSSGGGGKFCPLLSTTDGGGFGDSIGESCTKILKWSVWNGSGRSSIKSKLCTLLCDRCRCKWWWWWSRWCGETFVDWPILGLPWSRHVPILIVSKFLFKINIIKESATWLEMMALKFQCNCKFPGIIKPPTVTAWEGNDNYAAPKTEIHAFPSSQTRLSSRLEHSSWRTYNYAIYIQLRRRSLGTYYKLHARNPCQTTKSHYSISVTHTRAAC